MSTNKKKTSQDKTGPKSKARSVAKSKKDAEAVKKNVAEIDMDNAADADGNMLDFPVVGIGASAGGLEALQEFFENIGDSAEAAFVVIQHLSPDHESFMAELLSRCTKIPIDVVKNEMKVEPNHIYLIPPKMNMTIQNGTLYLKEIIGRSLNLPIDIFFRSLAADQQSNAVAVILSGTGSDGTLGIRAIKESGGVTLVQDETSAQFDGMPKSSISTGMVDLIRPTCELAKELANYIKHPLFASHGFAENQLSKNQHLYDRILSILFDATHVDFSVYKNATILRRLEKRVSINRFMNVADYVDYLVVTPREVSALFNDILIGVTRFFRDPDVFQVLEEKVIPELFRNRKMKSDIRVWIPGCSTGEEAFSIAILMKEYMMQNRILADVKIFATDIDQQALDYASIGFFPGNITSDVPLKYQAKYFSQHGNGYQINSDIRRMIIFARHNVIKDPPFFKLDFISCRNMLIYIETPAQNRVISGFHSGLNPSGFLLLGSSESPGKLAPAFDMIDSKSKLYRKRDTYKSEYMASAADTNSLHLSLLNSQQQKIQSRLGRNNQQLLNILEEIDNAFMPPSVVVDAGCSVVYTINVTDLLQVASGEMTTNLLKLLPREISVVVSSLIRRAEKTDEILSADAFVSDKETTIRCKRITPKSDNTVYYYLSFVEVSRNETSIDVTASDESGMSEQYRERIDDLEREVIQKKESLQAAVEELETNNEELQAANEELVASNEELQSTNEELQSVNEELYTVNEEHVRKIAEVTELNADYDNLLSNTQIGTLFLDTNMIIRKISKIASEITNILQTDVGRPLRHLSLNTLYPAFLKDVESVNASKKRIERELPFEDKFFFMRIVPYLLEDKTIKGIIISFVDLTESKISTALHEKTAVKKTVKKTAEKAVKKTPSKAGKKKKEK